MHKFISIIFFSNRPPMRLHMAKHDLRSFFYWLNNRGYQCGNKYCSHYEYISFGKKNIVLSQRENNKLFILCIRSYSIGHVLLKIIQNYNGVFIHTHEKHTLKILTFYSEISLKKTKNSQYLPFIGVISGVNFTNH